MSSIHNEIREWRKHLRQNRVVQKLRFKIEMPYLGEFIGE